MPSQNFTVAGIKCEHCVQGVTGESRWPRYPAPGPPSAQRSGRPGARRP
jgi:hypothetical protein